MEHAYSSTTIAGIDVGKFTLDAALPNSASTLQVNNDAQGIGRLLDWLVGNGVTRVGVEATGGYERKLRSVLEAQGVQVLVHQPSEVRSYGRFSRVHAKTDAGDARLIAAATAATSRTAKRADPELIELGERLVAYEHISDQLMRLRTFKQSLATADLLELIIIQIEHLKALKARLSRQLIMAIKASARLKTRYDLLVSLPGIGPIIAASLVVTMPELGSMDRGQPASLLGVAPHARDSGQHKGLRFISGGRSRPRRMLYLAALTARRYDKGLNSFADRLRTAGKPPKLVIVAIMRKLIEAANLVLKRNQPWTVKPQ